MATTTLSTARARSWHMHSSQALAEAATRTSTRTRSGGRRRTRRPEKVTMILVRRSTCGDLAMAVLDAFVREWKTSAGKLRGALSKLQQVRLEYKLAFVGVVTFALLARAGNRRPRDEKAPPPPTKKEIHFYLSKSHVRYGYYEPITSPRAKKLKSF